MVAIVTMGVVAGEVNEDLFVMEKVVENCEASRGVGIAEGWARQLS